MRRLVACSALMACFPVTSLAGAEPLANRLTAGVRISEWRLSDARRYNQDGDLDNHNPGNFVGSLWGLDPQQGWVPLPLLEYRVVSVAGVGVTYDEIRIKTLDWGTDEEGNTFPAGDGDIQLRGVQLYAFARAPNRTRVTPQFRLGWAHYWSSFDADPGWAASGRSFELQNTSGWFLGAGVNVNVWAHLGADVSVEYLALSDIAAKARLPGGHKNGAFPVSSTVLRLGVTYRF